MKYFCDIRVPQSFYIYLTVRASLHRLISWHVIGFIAVKF